MDPQQTSAPNSDSKVFVSKDLVEKNRNDLNSFFNLKDKKVKIGLAVSGLAVVLVLIGVFTMAFRSNPYDRLYPKPTTQASDVSPTQVPVTNGTASIILEGKTEVTAGEEFEIKIWVNTNENSNLFAADLRFDPKVLEAKKIDTKGSFISLFLSRSTDNKAGKVNIAGAVPNPGKTTNGNNEVLATVIFKAKARGQTTFEMAGESGVYSNITNKNILKDKKTLTINVK